MWVYFCSVLPCLFTGTLSFLIKYAVVFQNPDDTQNITKQINNLVTPWFKFMTHQRSARIPLVWACGSPACFPCVCVCKDSKHNNNGLSSKSGCLKAALINLAYSRVELSDSSVGPAERRRAYNNIGSSAARWQTTQWFSYLRLFVWLWSEGARERGSLSFFPPFLYSSLMNRKARTASGQTERTALVRYKACPIAVRSARERVWKPACTHVLFFWCFFLLSNTSVCVSACVAHVPRLRGNMSVIKAGGWRLEQRADPPLPQSLSLVSCACASCSTTACHPFVSAGAEEAANHEAEGSKDGATWLEEEVEMRGSAEGFIHTHTAGTRLGRAYCYETKNSFIYLSTCVSIYPSIYL